MFARCLTGLAIVFVVVTLTGQSDAADLKIYPIRLSLSPAEPVAMMSLHNAGSETTVLQMRVFAWNQTDGEDRLDLTRDVLANPGVFELAPGADQIARFGLHMPAAGQEQSFRVLIEEIPRQPPNKPGEIATLLRVSVPLFVEAGAMAGRLDWKVRPGRNGDIDVAVRNIGGAHVQLTDLRLNDANQRLIAERKLSVYVLPGTSHHLTLTSATLVHPRDRLTLAADTDQTAIRATVTAEAGADGQAVR